MRNALIAINKMDNVVVTLSSNSLLTSKTLRVTDVKKIGMPKIKTNNRPLIIRLTGCTLFSRIKYVTNKLHTISISMEKRFARIN